MTMSKHTPGPWTTPGTDGNERVISAQVKGRFRTIAHVYAPYADKVESVDERDANASLIAAAPDLLDALKCLVDNWIEMYLAEGDTLEDANRHDCIINASAAIAKAEGRTP